MDEYIDSRGEMTVFSTLDADSRNWLMKIDERGRDKVPFTSHYGHFRSIGRPHGQKNAPVTFQRAKDVIVASV